MYLGKESLLKKFPILKKFENQNWLSEESVRSDCNYKELPLKCAFALIEEMMHFIDGNVFNNNYQLCLSVKVRLEQILSLLRYFCEDTITEKTKKGDNVIQHTPTEMKQEQKKVKKGIRRPPPM